MRSWVRFPAIPWEKSRGDHGLGRLVEFGFKAPPDTTSPSITTHTSSGQRNCATWASQTQKSILTTNHEVPGSIPGSTVGILLEGEDSHGDHDLDRLVEFRFKVPPGTTSSSITTHTSSG